MGHSPWGCKELDTTERLTINTWKKKKKKKNNMLIETVADVDGSDTQ